MATPAPEKVGRFRQYLQTYQITKRSDPKIGLWTFGSLAVGALVGAMVFLLIPPHNGGWLKITVTIVGGILFGLLAALLVFSRRAEKAAFDQLEGRPGAAAAALGLLRRGWTVDQMIAFNKQQDLVHRVVGPPGIVLVGEGNPTRLRSLMTSERRKHERVVTDVPVHEIIAGNGEGEVTLRRLAKSIMKLPRAVKGAEITDILNRLKALDASRPNIPLPKGPVPTSMKGYRGNLRGR